MVLGGASRGALLILVATVMWSSAGLFVRLLDMDMWSLLGWRSVFSSLSMAAAGVVLNGRALFRFGETIGPGGLAAIPVMVVAMVCYSAALNLTSVANVMVIYATVPFVAAVLAYGLLREQPTGRAIAAAAVAFAGVAVMAVSETGASDVLGNGLALLMTVAFAASVVISRRWPSYDGVLVTCVASVLCGMVCFLMGSLGAGIVRPSLAQMGVLFLFSLATQSLSYMLFLVGSRTVPSAEAGLIALLDVVLGPLWVWLAFSERPSAAAMIGGSLVLLAVAGYLAAPAGRPVSDLPP